MTMQERVRSRFPLDNRLGMYSYAGVSLTPPILADRFASILGGLLRAVAASAAKRPADQAVLVLFWSYLQRRIRQFGRLAERVHNNTLPPPRTSAPPSDRPRPSRPPGLRLPSRLAWVLPLVPGSAVSGSQLQALLAEPEMQALLAAAPQAARIVRPLLRMLGTWIPPNLLPPPLLGPLASGPPPATAAASPPEASTEPAAPTPRPTTQPPLPPGLRRGPRGTIRLGSFILPAPG